MILKQYLIPLKTATLLLLLLFWGCAPVPADFLRAPKFDPSLEWQVIQTHHFRIYYHQGENATAQKAARIAEEVYTRLVPRLGWSPARATHLVLTDNEDIANGMAGGFPHNTIYINLTPAPSSLIPISERLDDWLRSVITHEYTHILQGDMAGGLPAFIRNLFGRYPFPFGIFNSTFPNDLQPLWLIEGLATQEETLAGTTNRAYSAYADMLLRMAILENRFPTIDQAAGQLDSWPGGHVHYLFGARFLEYIRQQFGDTAIKHLNLNYSDNLFPLFVDTNARETLRVSYVTLWNKWKTKLTQEYTSQRSELEGFGLTITQPLMNKGDENWGAQMSLTGEILFTSINPREYPSLRILGKDGKDRFLTRRNYGGTASWSPDGSQVAFFQLESFKNYSDYSDLYLYDFKSKQVHRLTEGARLRDPDFHPNGRHLVAVKGGQAQDRLVIYQLDFQRFDTLEWIDKDLLMSSPRWSPDGTQIVMSGWKNGSQDIYLVDMHSKQVKPIHVDKALDLAPTWSPDGRAILFSSDRTGVYNLFAYEVETQTLFQVTNVLGGAFMPDVSPDGHTIVFSYYSSHGFDLHSMAWDSTTWKRVDLDSSSKKGAASDPVPAQSGQGQPASASLPVKPYSPWPTLAPTYWVPTLFGYSTVSGTILGVATGGSDVLGKHQFDLDLLKEGSDLSASLNYYNDMFYPTIYLGLSNETRADTRLSKDMKEEFLNYREKQQELRVGITFQWLFFQSQSAISLGYQGERTSIFDTQPGVTPPESYDRSGFDISWAFNSAQYYPFSISPEEGHLWLLYYTRFDERLGSDFDESRYSVQLAWYDTVFKPNHVLVVAGDAIIQESSHTPLHRPRGYPKGMFKGRRSAFGTVAYRFPIKNIERGYRTWPIFLSRLHGEFFFDAGNAWDRGLGLSDLQTGIGAELKLNLTFIYWMPTQLIAGVAQGLDEQGEDQSYIYVQSGF